jgi:AraC-like DNA-binding protein
MYVHKRPNWEFFAVLKGRVGPRLATGGPPVLQQRHLWIFSPTVAHGWAGHRHDRCRVAVFHFGSVPHLLERLLQPEGWLMLPLTPAQCQLLVSMAAELQPHVERTTEKSLLHFDRALATLSLLALDHFPVPQGASSGDYALRKIEACEAWYGEHMAQRPTMEQVADAASVSTRHLRRLFHVVRHESPQAVFTRFRLQRAMALLAQTDLKLEVIADECGFASGSDFSRVFRVHRHISPNAWRRNSMRACKDRM